MHCGLGTSQNSHENTTSLATFNFQNMQALAKFLPSEMQQNIKRIYTVTLYKKGFDDNTVR